MLSVANGRQVGFVGSNKLYIGRKNKQLKQSPLANPFVLNKDGDRNKCVEKYRRWLWEHVKHWLETGEVNDVIHLLQILAIDHKDGQEIVLTCWCHPEACHGDVIVSCVEWLMKNHMDKCY